MIQTVDPWLSVAVMSAITILLRAVPLLLHKSLLRAPWMLHLNQELPLCVMVILVAHSLAAAGGSGTLLPQMWLQAVALGFVAGSYLLWRNALGSVALGLLVLGMLTKHLQ